jgi:predicted alternative tryptophan synthase beta-subunit
VERFKDFLKRNVKRSTLKLENFMNDWSFIKDDEENQKIYFEKGLPDDWNEYDEWSEDPDSYQFKLDGEKRWINKNLPISEELQQKLLKMDMGSIRFIANPSKVTQEYIIKKRPDLIKEIQNLDPELRKRYKPELDMAGIEV